jgi:type IX secretion system PorP/SprF family membrane protein
MRIKYYLIFLLMFSFCKLFAQINAPFTFSPWAQSYYNPAAMGDKEYHLDFTGILRQQAIGMDVSDKDESSDSNGDNFNQERDNNNTNRKQLSPNSGGQQVFIGIDSYIKKIKSAIGVIFLKDRVGTLDNIGFQLGYASKFRVRSGKLSVGIQLGFLNQKPADNYAPLQNPDETVNGVKKSESYMDFDVNFGVRYRTPVWYVGVSGAQLIGGVRISGEENLMRISRQLFFSGGYIWRLKTAVPWSVEPNILLRTDFTTWSFHLTTIARYNGILWFGLSYQHTQGIAALFGATPFYNNGNEYLKGLELGVAFTFPTVKYAWTSNGSWGDFELVVRYGFNFYKEKSLNGYGSSRHLYKNQY